MTCNDVTASNRVNLVDPASAVGPAYVADEEVGVSLALCDLRPWQLLLGACQKVKGEAMAVNEEANYTSVFVWTVGPEERQGRCEAGVVVRWCCSAHTGNEVSPCVGSVAEGP